MKIDDRFYIILAVEPGSDGPYETDDKAEREKKIGLKAGRYIRVRRDTRKPNKEDVWEQLDELSKSILSYLDESGKNRKSRIGGAHWEILENN